MPNSMLTDPIEIALAPNAPFKPVPSRVLSCFNESARLGKSRLSATNFGTVLNLSALASIVASILHAIYAVKASASRQADAIHLERTLDKWFMDLPEPLRYDTGVKKGSIPSPNVLTLHMQYWCAVLLLHRPLYVYQRKLVGYTNRNSQHPQLCVFA